MVVVVVFIGQHDIAQLQQFGFLFVFVGYIFYHLLHNIECRVFSPLLHIKLVMFIISLMCNRVVAIIFSEILLAVLLLVSLLPLLAPSLFNIRAEIISSATSFDIVSVVMQQLSK